MVGAEKPHRAIFEHALRTVGVERTEDVWMVGDNPEADVGGALAVGIRALLADGVYPDSVGMTVLDAALHIRDQAEDLPR
jgi:putative hydrolase of the HAD superfamily